MEKTEILAALQEIYQDVLDIEDIELTESTTADDVEEWDSLSHVQLVVAIEKEFKIKFTSKEILSWSNVGDLVNCIADK